MCENTYIGVWSFSDILSRIQPLAHMPCCNSSTAGHFVNSWTLFKTIAGSYNRERKWRDFLLRSEILQLVIDFTVISTRFTPREGRFVVETGKFVKDILSLAKSK